MTPTPTRFHRTLMIAAGLALVALPATGAVQSQDSQSAADGGVAVDAVVAAAPDVPASTAASNETRVETMTSRATAAERDDSSTESDAAGSDTAGSHAALAVPSDETGSTEAQKVARSCGAPDDPHYQPSSGRDADQCYDSEGDFRAGRSYTATHFANNVDCGDRNLVTGTGQVGLYVAGTGGADGGYVSVCSDDQLPVQGRATLRGDTGATAVTTTADGDKDNPEETSQGWATATLSPAGPEYRCGKSYADGGRGTADAPTGEDTAEQCDPS